MTTTTTKELKTLAEIFATPKPNKLYCGVPDVYFLYHGEWGDPEVMYQDKYFNLPMDVETPLWSEYEECCEEFGKKMTDEGFAEWIENNPESVHDVLDNLIEAGMFKEDN